MTKFEPNLRTDFGWPLTKNATHMIMVQAMEAGEPCVAPFLLHPAALKTPTPNSQHGSTSRLSYLAYGVRWLMPGVS